MYIGAGRLDVNNLQSDKDKILKSINDDIYIIRQGAEKYRAERTVIKNGFSKNKPTNFISILGERGSGKTSLMLTLLDELKKDTEKNCESEEPKQLDFIISIIDPSMFNVEKNALGWILYSFEDRIKELEKKLKENYCNDKTEALEGLKGSYEKVKNYYLKTRSFYRGNLAALSEGKREFENVNNEIIKADLKLERAFSEFIDSFIDVTMKLYCHKNKTPLIIIPFDDIDLSPQCGPDILECITNYLKHPNIVVIMSGEFKTFRESLFIDLWNKENIPNQLDKDIKIGEKTIFDTIDQRVDEILGKVMPPKYRYTLRGLLLKERLLFTPLCKRDEETIAEKLLKIKCFRVTDNYEYETWFDFFNLFIEDQIDLTNILEKTKKVDPLNHEKYSGYEEDVEELKEYCNKAKDFINNYGKFFWNEDLVKDKKVLKKKIEEILENYNPSRYAYILPENPRGLVNLYYKLDDIINLLQTTDDKESPRHKLQLKKIENKHNFISYKEKTSIYSNNYIILKMFYDIIVNSNIKISYSENIIKMDDIINFSDAREKVRFNFKKIYISSPEEYKYYDYNVSPKLLRFNFINNDYLKENAEETTLEIRDSFMKLNHSQSAVIQMFYDLSEIFLHSSQLNIICEKNLRDIIVYKDSSDNELMVYMMDLKTFKNYYKFQKMYESSIPIIKENSRANTLRNLKVELANILNDIRWKSEPYKRKYNKEQELNEDELRQIYANYYKENIPDIFKDYDENKLTISNFIIFSGYDLNVYKEEFDYYINKSPINILYSDLLDELILEQKDKSGVEGVKYTINKYKNTIDFNTNPLNRLNKFIKEYDKGKKVWEDIKFELFNINCIFIVRLVKEIFEDEILSKRSKIDSVNELMNIFIDQTDGILKFTKVNRIRFEILLEEATKIINDVRSILIQGKSIVNITNIIQSFLCEKEGINIAPSAVDNKILGLSYIYTEDEVYRKEIMEVYRQISLNIQYQIKEDYKNKLKNITKGDFDDELLTNLKAALKNNNANEIREVSYEIVSQYFLTLSNEIEGFNMALKDFIKYKPPTVILGVIKLLSKETQLVTINNEVRDELNKKGINPNHL